MSPLFFPAPQLKHPRAQRSIQKPLGVSIVRTEEWQHLGMGGVLRREGFLSEGGLALSQPLHSCAALVESICPHELLGNKGDASWGAKDLMS